MLVKVTGCRPYSFKDEASGNQVEGLSVYYYGENPADETLKGMITDKVSLRKGTMLYDKMIQANYREPFDAIFSFDMVPGRKTAALVSVDIAN